MCPQALAAPQRCPSSCAWRGVRCVGKYDQIVVVKGSFNKGHAAASRQASGRLTRCCCARGTLGSGPPLRCMMHAPHVPPPTQAGVRATVCRAAYISQMRLAEAREAELVVRPGGRGKSLLALSLAARGRLVGGGGAGFQVCTGRRRMGLHTVCG